MNFRLWLELEEIGVHAYKKPNPKNLSQNFIVLYGNTKPLNDNLKSMGGLKGLGFSWFGPQKTWSTIDSKFTDSVKQILLNSGVDLSGLDAVSTQKTSISEPQEPQSKTNSILQVIHTELKDVIEKDEDSGTKKLLTFIDNMIERVANSTDEAAKQDFIKNFLKFSSKFHNYSLHNQLLIWIQTNGAAINVASAGKWQELGRDISDWTKNIKILAPINFKKITDRVDPVTGQNSKEEVQLRHFKVVKVFDVSATTPVPGHPSPFQPVTRKDWSKDSNEEIEELNVLVNSLVEWCKNNNITIDYEQMKDELGGYSVGGKIAVNNSFKGINLFSTLAHEAAHEILHQLKKGDKTTIDKFSSRKEKEIDAETTAFIVCNHFGFETKDSVNYLALWQAKGDEIRARRRNIQKAATTLITGIKKQVEETNVEFDGEN